MKECLITREQLAELARDLLAAGWEVVAPDMKSLRFAPLRDAAGLRLAADGPPTRVSAKEWFFPRTEPILLYERTPEGYTVTDPPRSTARRILFGARPCDTAAQPILDPLFNWDYKDDFFNGRVERTIVVGMACGYRDEFCFCTSVGLSSDDPKGADLFLTPEGNSFRLRIITPRGEAFAAEYSRHLSGTEIDEPAVPTPPLPQDPFDTTALKLWLDENFASDEWNAVAPACLGCAQCAYVCPTCHCFDIVDEEESMAGGRRVKNWDACQFGLFTKHASGHNPRGTQAERYRQRISHKFKYYPDRFGAILCTGCGRCSRGCPVGIDIAEVARALTALQEAH